MIGGGVETTGGRDQFSGHFHAHQHFASGFAVVAGGLEDVRDGLGDSAVLQEAQDVYDFRSSWPRKFSPLVIEQTSSNKQGSGILQAERSKVLFPRSV